MYSTQIKRYVNGEQGGFELDEMRCWEFAGGHTEVTFKSGVTVRFRDDLREKIKAAQALPAFSLGWGGGVAFNGDPNLRTVTTSP